MLTTRTPLRVSFFGGGTDYPEYFRRFPGAVLGTAINKYIYISSLPLESIVGFNFRLSYSINEEVKDVGDIKHPVFRALLQQFKIDAGWNFSVMASLPSGSGLGSSSSFTVGLIKLLSSMQSMNLTRYDLAQMAINVERNILKENVGIQDQIHAAFGSLNRYDFSGADFTITPVRMHSDMRDALNTSMYLVFSGVERRATNIAKEQIAATEEKKIDRQLSHLHKLVEQSQAVLEAHDADVGLRELGKMLDDAWMTKRSLSSAITTPAVDNLYEAAKASGALGGKLCGAGGGGFFFLLIAKGNEAAVAERIKPLTLIPISMDETGCMILQK